MATAWPVCAAIGPPAAVLSAGERSAERWQHQAPSSLSASAEGRTPQSRDADIGHSGAALVGGCEPGRQYATGLGGTALTSAARSGRQADPDEPPAAPHSDAPLSATMHRRIPSALPPTAGRTTPAIDASAGGATATSSGDEDPLLAMARRCPEQARRLLLWTTFSIGSTSGGLALACVGLLAAHWSDWAACDRPLRCWHAVLSAFQAVQAPLRLRFFFQLYRLRFGQGDLSRNLQEIITCRLWSLSQGVSLFNYLWLLLGIVWATNAGSCFAHCSRLQAATWGAIVLSALRILLTFMAMRLVLPPEAGTRVAQESPKCAGATAADIAALPVTRFAAAAAPRGFDDESPASSAPAEVGGAAAATLLAHVPAQRQTLGSAPSCAVCLSDYADGDLVRELPCGHRFHQRCSGLWLTRSKRCPLCMRAIDDPPKKLGGFGCGCSRGFKMQ
mmetsp:Transcript_78032/g.225661  ORF Transcript_78032/g.225661 Transcript_78032/m.225661 type:complete len:447 (+) Transcript_78032:28-1368(+)